VKLLGKTALVTGSAKGLGKRTALELARMGCDVVLNYVTSRREAEEVRGQIESLGRRAIAVQADVADPDGAEKLIRAAEQALGPVDILVNNAGPFIAERRLFGDYAPEEIRRLVAGNLIGPMLLNRLVLPGMRRKRWGRIIHFGFSRAAEAPAWPYRSVYAAAKVALVSLTKTLAAEEAANGITVNMVCPGDIRGDFKEKDIGEAAGGGGDADSPGVRPGTGEDVARVVAFLCQPESDFVTGNAIEVSGGFDPIAKLSALLRQP